MRRIIIIGVALTALAAAATAYAAINTYTGSYTFSPKGPGSSSHPSPLGYTENLTARGTNGNRTATLLDIKIKIYGLVADGKDFPTCSLQKIASAHGLGDSVCPRKAEVATGAITAVIGSATNFKAPAAPCDPYLDVWNGGQGKLVYFFRDGAAGTPHACVGGLITTGAVGPYPGTYKVVGKYFVMDTPEPRSVDYPVPGQVGSLTTLSLKWLKVTKTVNGKTVAATASVACLHHSRPYSTTFTATIQGTTQTTTVPGKAPC